MKRSALLVAALVVIAGVLAAQDKKTPREVPLPTSKILQSPSPGKLGPTNSFPVTIAISPDGHYAALLNFGYGTQATQARQSISVLDLATNQLTDFPDDRLGEEAHQSYFIGLGFSTDGKTLYASVGSITDPSGEKRSNTGNGIAVYSFDQGKIAPKTFLKIGPQKLAPGRRAAYGLRKVMAGSAIPYPAGLAVVRKDNKDLLLVANNLSDNVVLLDPND
ncbi:MAG TPA: hypothetical protein VJQ82_13390, partial [Terriglobales bacterium]|nr:hypothetical protein [Terriglobales bacterium]